MFYFLLQQDFHEISNCMYTQNFSNVRIWFLLTQHVKHKKIQSISLEMLVLQKSIRPDFSLRSTILI